ncbi:hypothetical protein BDP55DRAFT_740091 [Colletotrichum godetiae]|uniref:Uncharacterized protein n=1 Tax=Colletotrichum godetiae TaxID=1209918 RepID=A0AAJ0EKM8_9PEZI|nr:uncharacterized protein BDP55DRAFT_740091 [Colletotrichum godetiae]KAK1656625.1 hypothetical protein BDP55DRAFT_740091 [Colletotrichum godetiae]
MSTESQNIPQNPVTPIAIKGPAPRPTLPLPSPEATPEVEDGRIQAERRRTAATAQQLPDVPAGSTGNMDVDKATQPQSGAGAHVGEVPAQIQRILGCADDSYAEILEVRPDATEKETAIAWRRLGCLLHASVTDHQNADKAFHKLHVAAQELSVNHLEIDEVVNWDGEKLPDLEDESPMEVDPIPVPPQAGNPDDPVARKEIHNFNMLISDFNAAEKEASGADDSDISPDRWCISLQFFGTHFNLVRDNYKILLNDRSNQEARDVIAAEKKTGESCMRCLFAGTGNGAEVAKAKRLAESQAVIQYLWPTAQAADGSLIIGVRKQGQFGHQVCVEMREEDGRVIRRLQSASEAGLLEVERYRQIDGYKNLAEGQSQWSCDDRNDFEELLWVTESHIKRKNTAARKKNPTADCCVKFRTKGIQILTVSSFSMVLGRSSARAEIEKICRRDNIAPPWDAGYISEYYDPSRLEKDPVRRRALQNAQAASSAKRHLDVRKQGLDEAAGKTDRTPEQQEDRVRGLEEEIMEMKKMMIALTENIEKLVGSAKASAQPKKE